MCIASTMVCNTGTKPVSTGCSSYSAEKEFPNTPGKKGVGWAPFAYNGGREIEARYHRVVVGDSSNPSSFEDYYHYLLLSSFPLVGA